MVSATSSASKAVSTASAPSPMSSPAPGPTIPTPSTRPVSGSTISLVRPSLRPSVAARPDAAHWNLATFTARPSRAACDSVRPHHATSGSVNTTAGTTTLSNATGRPAIASAATLPWRIARCASIGSPVASPTAHTWLSAVRPRSSTCTKPRSLTRTRVVSRPSPRVLGRRPTATSARSNVSGAPSPRRASMPPPVSRSAVTRVPSLMAANCFWQRRRRRARRHDGVLEGDLLRLVAGHAQAARVLERGAPAEHLDILALGHAGQPARELADDALALPLAQRIERHARLAEVHAELLGALGLRQHPRHVQQRLGRNAALEEARAPQALVEIDDDRLQPELGAPERGRVAAGPAADDGHVHLAHEIAHHHLRVPAAASRVAPGAARSRWRSGRRRRRRPRGGRT